jgi:glycosyltransferase involved in cell wall biosynthesis
MTGGRESGRHLHLLLPGDPLTATGGYLYDRRMAEGLRQQGWRVDVHGLDHSFPQPTPAALAHADQTLTALGSDACVLIDGLALGAMPEVAHRHAQRLRLIGLVHHPLAAETGLSPQRAQVLEASERAALRAVRGVIVTSPETAVALTRYDVPAERIFVVEPGTAAASGVPRSGNGSALLLLCVASLTPRKGHDLLLEALATQRHHDWHLTIAGSTDRDPPTRDALRSQITRLDLSTRVTLAGELGEEALQSLYRDADVFVLASRFEGYGMAVAEALMHALPVVATTTGASARIVPADAGILVPPDDGPALQAALARVLGDAALRRQLAHGAGRAALQLRSWPQAAARLQSALHAISGA